MFGWGSCWDLRKKRKIGQAGKCTNQNLSWKMLHMKFFETLRYKRSTQFKGPDIILIYKTKRTFHLVDFAVSMNHRLKLKEIKKINKGLDLAREQKKLWNMRVMVVPIVFGVPGTFLKGLKRDWRNWRWKRNRDHPDYSTDHPDCSTDYPECLWWCSGWQARLANLQEWVRVSLGAPFIWPCATSKQKA